MHRGTGVRSMATTHRLVVIAGNRLQDSRRLSNERSYATSCGVVNKPEKRMNESVEKSDDKPELHLMPGKGINTHTIAQMFKSLTGKDMTAEERAKMDAEFKEFYAKKAEVEKQAANKSNLRI